MWELCERYQDYSMADSRSKKEEVSHGFIKNLFAQFPHLHSYLLTYSLFSMWLVCEYHYTRAECLRLNKFEFLLLALTMKKPLPVSYYNGEDHETVFIC